MDEYYAKYAGNNTGNGASDTDFESPEPDTTSSNNVKFLEEQQASKILILYQCLNVWQSFNLCLWQYELSSFQGGIQNWKHFCLKINIPKGNCWILRIGVKKCQNVTFKVNFLCQKSSKSF